MNELRAAFVDQKVDVLLKSISRQQEELIRVVSNIAKEGRSAKKTQEEVQSIMLELNKCNNELPEKYTDISSSLENAITELQKALSSGVTDVKTLKDYLLEADGYLKGCMRRRRAQAV